MSTCPVCGCDLHAADPFADSPACPTCGRAEGLSVLVVEDNADAAASLATLLRLWGHSARVARDGPNALRMAAEAAPDVALIDVRLPGMDGLAVAAGLRDRAGPRRPLLVAVTGYGQDEDRRRSLAAGMDLHLVKPVEPEQLRHLLRRFGQVLAPPAPVGRGWELVGHASHRA